MKRPMSLPVPFLLLLLSTVASAKLTNPLGLARSSFPSVHAQELIRAFNLFPKEDINIIDGPDSSIFHDSPRLVEKRFNLPNLVGSGVSLEDLGHHAGYFKIEHSHAARMFYLFFESRTNKKDPVVIWLTGGPGCSSELAVFYENGPFNIANNLSLVWNEYGWDKASNLLYVDQPIGTGFSYSTDRRDSRHSEDGISNDLYDFLQAFFAEHPELAKNDFYITGESYAGHYIPAFAARVHRGNKAKEGVHINLKGFAIGNGLTEPAIQYKAYTDFALDNGIITKTDHDRINKVLPVCEMAIKLCGTDGTVSCVASYFVCNTIFSSILARAGNLNYYDIRKKCEGSFCYDFSNMEKFLNQKPVREALGVGDLSFVSCSPTVYQAMLVDWMRNLEVGIPTLLEDGIQLLVYAGEYDLICNWLGNSRWVHAMEWSGQKEFVSSPEVHDSGHMVPMDQPKAALEMLRRWTQGTLSEAAAEPEKLFAQM
ncbi:hypothetical protein GBA52_007142 [Prunus armeniaca]|nr:hypothetical protein GBA52_007142 [Prunus armeniaca]